MATMLSLTRTTSINCLALTRTSFRHRITTIPCSQQLARYFSTTPPEDKSSSAKNYKSIPALIPSLLALSKARLSLLVVTTTSLGFLTAGPVAFALPAKLASVTTGTALCSASAATFNQIIEVDRDSSMKRTRTRPLVTQQLSKPIAISWGVATGVSGAVVLGLGTDSVTTALGVGNIVLYSGIYTYLKPRSEWNTWVGAIVGAVPPVMGWTAATGGSLMDAEPLIMGSTLFLWQFPHFFALNWMYREDYKRGGFAMVATSDPNGSRTAALITRYTLYLSAVPIFSSLMEITSPMFAVESLLLNAYTLHVANNFDKERSNANARKVFLTSLWYLPCVMMLFLLHSRQWNEMEHHDEQDSFILHSLKAKGRELCIHEAIASKDVWIGSSKENGTTLDESKCPSIALKNITCKDDGMDIGNAGAIGEVGEGFDFMSWYMDIPIISRLYFTGAFLTTAGCALDIISPFSLYFNFDLIFFQGQIWRLITTYLFFGMFSIDFLFHMYFLVRYCRMLEEGDFRGKTAHFVMMIIFGITFMTLVAPFVSVHFLGSSLTFMMVYVWGRRNEEMHMNFLGFFTFNAPYLPWVMLLFSVLLGNPITIDAIGILVGHTYYFLEYVYPSVAEIRGWRRKKILEPPRILHWLCGTYQEPRDHLHQD